MTVAGELSASLRWSLLEVGAAARGELGGGNGTYLGGYFGVVDRLPSGDATIGTAGLMLFVGWTHDLGQ